VARTRPTCRAALRDRGIGHVQDARFAEHHRFFQEGLNSRALPFQVRAITSRMNASAMATGRPCSMAICCSMRSVSQRMSSGRARSGGSPMRMTVSR
jgi:hypothetical protein